MFPLEFMDIAFHHNQPIPQHFPQKIPNRFRFHEIVCVYVEEIGEGAGIRDEEARGKEGGAEEENSVIRCCPGPF